MASAHDAILGEAERDPTKSGMGTTIVGAMIVGGELMFAHAGDSRAYLVRDGISMQLTEDHTLLARLLAAGIDVDTTGEGSRFRCMLTNALGIGQEIKVSMFVVPLADGDRFLLCSDGISEYVAENEVGEVLSKQPSPARAAQRLIDLALERGGGDNATALVVRVLEAGETPLPAEQRKRDDAAILKCALWGKRVTPQQRLRALRIAIPRDHGSGEMLPAHALGDRVAWVILDGALVQDGEALGPGALIYPESLLGDAPLPDRDAYAFTRSDVRALAIRSDDFRELCDDDSELGEALLESLAAAVAERRPRIVMRRSDPVVDARGNTDPNLPVVRATDPEPTAVARADAFEEVDPFRPTDPRVAAVRSPTGPEAYRPTDPKVDAVAFRPTDPRVEVVAPERRATTDSEDFRATDADDDEADEEPTAPEPRVARLRAAEPVPINEAVPGSRTHAAPAAADEARRPTDPPRSPAPGRPTHHRRAVRHGGRRAHHRRAARRGGRRTHRRWVPSRRRARAAIRRRSAPAAAGPAVAGTGHEPAGASHAAARHEPADATVAAARYEPADATVAATGYEPAADPSNPAATATRPHDATADGRRATAAPDATAAAALQGARVDTAADQHRAAHAGDLAADRGRDAAHATARHRRPGPAVQDAAERQRPAADRRRRAAAPHDAAADRARD